MYLLLSYYFSPAYYFTPMILNGCLALASGVIESYCHQKPTSSEAPYWINKLLRNRKGHNNKTQARNGQGMDPSDSSEGENVVNAEVIVEIGGQKSTWKDLALLTNRLTLLLCILITLVSAITITVKFILLL